MRPASARRDGRCSDKARGSWTVGGQSTSSLQGPSWAAAAWGLGRPSAHPWVSQTLGSPPAPKPQPHLLIPPPS